MICLMMSRVISLALLTLTIGVAPARAIDLTCSGVMHSYVSGHIEGEVAPAAAVVDLEGKRITTPVGDFHITKVAEDSISFDDPTNSQRLLVFGTLDRMSGLMRVFWNKPHDNTKAAMYSELHCSAAKRLF